MKPELIIWDWNGTILDDACVCKTIANIMLKERGIPTLPDMDAYRAVFGFPIKAYYEKFGKKVGIKVAGGVSTTVTAIKYRTIVSHILGEEWITPEYFRIGTSKLLDDAIRSLNAL